MPSVYSNASAAFESHIKLALSSLAVEDTPSWLLAGVITNVMAGTSAHLKLDPITTRSILSLRNQVSALCAVYDIDDVVFHFDSPLDAPYQLIVDFFALDMSSAMLSKNPMYWRGSKFTEEETQLLLNFLALVRALMRSYGTSSIAQVVSYNKTSLLLPPTHIRHTKVGPRVTNAYCGFEVATPSTATRTNTKPRVRFNLFTSRSHPAVVQRARSTRLDLNDESSLRLLSDAPLRMRRRRAFGFGLF